MSDIKPGVNICHRVSLADSHEDTRLDKSILHCTVSKESSARPLLGTQGKDLLEKSRVSQRHACHTLSLAGSSPREMGVITNILMDFRVQQVADVTLPSLQ